MQHNSNNNAAPAVALRQNVHNSSGPILAIFQSLSSRNKEHAWVTKWFKILRCQRNKRVNPPHAGFL
jgi:hypothetical protein